MKIKIVFFAELKEIFGQSRVIDLHEGSTIGEIVDLLAGESDRFYSKKTSLVCAVNETFEMPEKELKDRDELALMTPMYGG